MKVLIIILALVGVTFIGLLVLGEARSEQPKRGCERMPPSFKSKDGPSEDDLNDWCPPSIANATKGLQARFAPDLGLKKSVRLSSASMGGATFGVAHSDKKVRAAHIVLAQGDAAILSDGDKGKLCLCRPGQPMSDALFGDGCGDRWKSDHQKKQHVCQKDDDRGILPFQEDGGRIVLEPQPPATVTIE
jgi:hypothetical protein